jgi:putative aldouronate transport system substrate-binding protein
MASQAEKSKLEFYAKLYKDGLLDPEYLTDAWDAMEQKFYDGAIAFIAGTAGDVIQVYDNKMMSLNGEASALTVLPPAKGVSQGYTSIDTTKESRGFAINIDSPNKDAAWAVLEFMASPEGRILDKLGTEGVHYNVADAQTVFTEKWLEWRLSKWPTPLNLVPAAPLAEPILTAAAQSSLDNATIYYHADTNILVPSDMAPQYDAMVALYNEYAADIVTGKKDISAFDEFVAKFNEAGGTAFSDLFATELK